MLEVKWKVKYKCHFFILYLVSILVMLEVKWKVRAFFLVRNIKLGFNPCYVGSKMESIEVDMNRYSITEFQSLLCWK